MYTVNQGCMSVATVCHIRFVTSGFVVSRDISPGYRTWDVFEGSEFLFLQFGPYYQNSSSTCLTRFFGIVPFIVPHWYVGIKDQLTEATVEELFGSLEAIIWFSGGTLFRIFIGFRLVIIDNYLVLRENIASCLHWISSGYY